MKGPNMSIRIVKDPRRKIWQVNEDPALLDAMYNRFLGPHGDKMLPDEIKWLAVTHKSFDYARRGFNTRLAYYGTWFWSGSWFESWPSGLAGKPDADYLFQVDKYWPSNPPAAS